MSRPFDPNLFDPAIFDIASLWDDVSEPHPGWADQFRALTGDNWSPIAEPNQNWSPV